MSDLIINATDSLEVAIGYFLAEEFETAPKHATLGVFHAVELLLKECLHRVHPLFIYSNIDRSVTPAANTVGMTDAFVRLANLGVHVEPSDRSLLTQLQAFRNEIVHHRFDPSKNYRLVIGKALRFIYYFSHRHLGTTLEDLLPDLEADTYRQVRELILEEEERLAEARRLAGDSSLRPGPTDALPIAICPVCGYETLVVGSDRGDFCFFCHEEYSVEQCSKCGTYVSADVLTGADMCPDCLDALR